jgi:NTP pyrophosphatase (non-canonical NTP hydrolase)
MTQKIDLEKYTEFVKGVTSGPSEDLEKFIARLRDLAAGKDGVSINVPLMVCGGIGLGSEGGEFEEVVKKILFQEKPMNEETRFHMKRELGDIIWYWINACRALGLDPNTVIAENVTKLEARYPGGKFDAFYSENRKTGDL